MRALVRHISLLLAASLLTTAYVVAQDGRQGTPNVDSDSAVMSVDSTMHLQVSLLTCGPGEEIYEYYGHSAIRVLCLDSAGLDVTFNYGIFDFNSGNFALRFALGHTDYVCAMQQTVDFINHYWRKGIYIDEQVLNISQAEARRLFDALLVNCRPENCVYRYSFFFDNCATRVRDKIEECIDSKLHYPDRPSNRSLRDAVHFYCRPFQWSEFGQDLLLGSEADQPATGRVLQFAPLIMETDFSLTVTDDSTGMKRPIVDPRHRLLDLPPIDFKPAFPLSPLAVAVVLLVAGLIIGLFEYRRRRILWPIDTALLLLQGIGGIIVAFLFFFSTHPTVGSNWQVWVLNPLPLVGLWWQIKGGRTRCYHLYHCVAAPVIAAFLIALPLIPQYVSPAMIVLTSLLLLRSLLSLLVSRRIRQSSILNPQFSMSSPLGGARGGSQRSMLLLFGVLVPFTTYAADRTPRIVVNITVDGLRSDLLEAFMPLYTSNGFRLLLENGQVYTHAQCPYAAPNRAASIATIATGTVPYDHGIIGMQWLSRSTLRPVFCVEDPSVKGLQTTENLSPRNLGVSTIADELKVSTRGRGFVYSIAPYSDAAILSAGHSADGVYWLDSQSGRWASSTYYTAQLPQWVSGAATPGTDSNEAVVSMAETLLRCTTLGIDEVPDYLAVTLAAANQNAEVSYPALDRSVASLIRAAEQSVGSGNALFILTSTGTPDEETEDLEPYRIPTGQFHIDRTANLLNMMLMAVYGEGNYIEAIYDNQIYLNRTLIEQRQLNVSEVLDRSQELLLQCEGVKDVYTTHSLLLGASVPGLSSLRNAYNPALSGDLFIRVAPGWHLVNETTGQQRLVRESYVNFPIIIYGLQLPAETIDTPVTTDCIAPTVAGIMRIRAPNACRTAPLPTR